MVLMCRRAPLVGKRQRLGSGLVFEHRYHQLFITAAYRYLLARYHHIGGCKCIYLILRHYERPMNAQEIIFGQQAFDLTELEFGENTFVARGNAYIFAQAFDKQDFVEINFYSFLAFVEKDIQSFSGYMG